MPIERGVTQLRNTINIIVTGNALAGIQIRTNSDPIVRLVKILPKNSHICYYILLCIIHKTLNLLSGTIRFIMASTEESSKWFSDLLLYTITKYLRLRFIELGIESHFFYFSVHEKGQGLIEENEVYANSLAGVWCTTGKVIHSNDNYCFTYKYYNLIFYHLYNISSGLLEGSTPVSIKQERIIHWNEWLNHFWLIAYNFSLIANNFCI